MGSALSVMATNSPPMRVGVVPDPACVWPGLTCPVLGYGWRQVTFGAPEESASKRYRAPSVTTYTPPVSSTACELPIGSRVASTLAAPVRGSTTPTTPPIVAYQMR